MNSNNNISNLYYSQNNLDNTYTQVSEEILRRTNKDISKNASYRSNFDKMAKLVYDKLPDNDRNLNRCNTILIDKCVGFFHNKIFQKQVGGISRPQASNSISNPTLGFTMIKDNDDLNAKMNDLVATRQTLGTGSGIRGDGNPQSYVPQPILSPSHPSYILFLV